MRDSQSSMLADGPRMTLTQWGGEACCSWARGRGKFVAVNLLSGRLSSGYPLPSFLILIHNEDSSFLILFIFIVPAKKGTVLAFLPAFFVCLCRVGSRTGP